ncbi:MAG: carbon storage regulator [Gemmataceae bacterium]
MLVLSRKVGEEIVIDQSIRLRVLGINGNQIRLGFIAPRDISIQRQELLEIDREIILDLAGEREPALV